MKEWDKKDIYYLISNYDNTSNFDLSRILNKSLLSINSKASRLGLKKSNNHISGINRTRVSNRWGDSIWTKDEIDYLVSNINNMTNSEISKELDRSIDSIVSMSNKLKIKRIKKYNKEYIEKECLKYITKSELRISDPNLYHWLYNNGKMKDVSTHMLNISYSTPQLILNYIIKKLTGINPNYNDRSAIKPYEIDIYFPLYKFGIEYDGSFYHQDGNNFKKKLCSKNGITLVTITEKGIKKGFEGYVDNIKKQISKKLPIVNSCLSKNITLEEVLTIKIDKSEIFKGLFDISKIKEICNKYDDYTLFIHDQKNIYSKLYYLGLLQDYTSHMKVKSDVKNESLRFLIERSNYYNIGDKVLIEYWYNDVITVVSILEKNGKYYKVTHNIQESKLFNAPDERIKSSDIIDHYRK